LGDSLNDYGSNLELNVLHLARTTRPGDGEKSLKPDDYPSIFSSVTAKGAYMKKLPWYLQG